MALIMIGVKTSKDPRAGIQNGFVLTALDCIDSCGAGQFRYILCCVAVFFLGVGGWVDGCGFWPLACLSF